MLTIRKNVTNEIIINKSRFIAKVFKINDELDVNDILIDLRKTYKDATHFCYAYIINEKQKANDDGEPSGTAGLPILNVLKQNDLNYVLCVVIRYFGGIKLGAGGLVRAYTKATTLSLAQTVLKEIVEGKVVSIIFSYKMSKNIDYLLRGVMVINKAFKDNILYDFIIDNAYFDEIKEQLLNNCLTLDIKKEITL